MFDLSYTNVRTFLISNSIDLLIVMFDSSHTNVRTFLISNSIGLLIVMFDLFMLLIATMAACKDKHILI
jgi:hypothetical protein